MQDRNIYKLACGRPPGSYKKRLLEHRISSTQLAQVRDGLLAQSYRLFNTQWEWVLKTGWRGKWWVNNLTLYGLSDWYRWSLVLFDFLFGNGIIHGISSQSHTGSSESFIELSMIMCDQDRMRGRHGVTVSDHYGTASDSKWGGGSRGYRGDVIVMCT